MIQRPLHDKNYEYNGFDSQHNDIMGGRNLTLTSIDEKKGRNHSEDQSTTRLETNSTMNWKGKFITMTRNENPYTKQQKEPEWDGSEIPQIVNNVNGKVTVLGTDGKASSYRDERSYKLANATYRFTQKLSSTGKCLEKRAVSGLRMPAFLSERDGSSSGSNRGADTI